MTAETNERVTPSFGEYPRIGTYPVAANEEIIKGCFVAVDGDNRAVDYSDDGNGYTIVGVARAGVDNRTTAPSGGGAGALDVDVRFGVFEFAYTDTAPAPRAIVYGVDNQTVSTTATSAVSDFRGVAGIVIQTDSTAGTCRVFMGGWMQDVRAYAAIVTALAAEVGDYTGGGGAEADLATGAIELETDANTEAYEIPLPPITAWRLNDGDHIPKYVDGTDGITLDDSEVCGLRINNESTTVFMCDFKVPDDVDDTAALVFRIKGYRTGTTDTGAILTLGAFSHATGAAHTADDDAGGDTGAFDVAGADTFDEVTKTFAAGALAAGDNVTLTMVIKDTTLDTDDLIVTTPWLVGTRVQHTS